MREETCLDVETGRLLYVCDHPAADVLHVVFEASVLGGVLGRTAGGDTAPIRGVQYIPITQLPEHGFTTRSAIWPPLASPTPGPTKANIGL